MSKKNLVKKVIDNLLKEGKEFADLTQGSLAMIDELEGVSRTTIKRAKKEYKQEKIVVQKGYIEQSIKRRIYKYLDRHPKSTLGDLREALPEVNPVKVSEYHQIWKRKKEKFQDKKVQQAVVISPRKLKEMIISYLDKQSSVTLSELYSAFPEANRSSVSSYFGQWKKKQQHLDTGKKGGLFQVFFTFLDKNPKASIQELQKNFSDVPATTLKIYQNMWLQKKKSQANETENLDEVVMKLVDELIEEEPSKKVIKTTSEKISKDVTADISGTPKNNKRKNVQITKSAKNGKVIQSIEESDGGVLKNQLEIPKNEIIVHPVETNKNSQLIVDKELIHVLKSTIDAQKTTIRVLKSEHSMLKEKQGELFPEFENMNDMELKEIKDFLMTYINGLRIVE